VGGLPAGWWQRFGSFGSWALDDGWAVVEGIEPARVPELVRAVVLAGGEVGAVVPERKSLEDRFLELLGES
jgi:hypothetical protein